MDAVSITEEQVFELVKVAYRDTALWNQFKDREREIEKAIADARAQGYEDRDEPGVVLDPPQRPTLSEMVLELVQRRYGADQDYDRIGLFYVEISIRRLVREELGLWTYLGFADDADGADAEPEDTDAEEPK